jgi:hypothetical protein
MNSATRFCYAVPMKRSLLRVILLQAVLVFPAAAYSQMKIDLPLDTVRRAANKTYLDDLAVHDTALLYMPFCIDNGALFVPGWSSPADLANSQYPQSGLMLRVEVLPAKKVRGTLIDAAQAQAIAKGSPNAPSVLSTADYKKAVIAYVNTIYEGGFFGIGTCDEERRRKNPLRVLNLFSLESINGFTKLSDLLASVTTKER